MARRVILRLLAAAALFVTLHLSLLAFRKYLETKPTLRIPNFGGLYDTTITKKHPKLCYYKECLQGNWVPREPKFATLDDAKKEFPHWERCRIPGPPKGKMRPREQKKALEAERFLNVTNWVWKPREGEQIDWDAEDIVVRMLQMPGGIIFMGDTITHGHETAFRLFLETAGISLDSKEAKVKGRRSNNIHAHILRPNTTMTTKLQLMAGVPDSRLQYPVFTFIEDQLLLPQKEMLDIARRHGAPAKSQWKPRVVGVEGWESYLLDVTRPRIGEGTTVTRDTVVVLNTGAHWSRGKIYVLPEKVAPAEEQTALTNMYSDMIKVVLKRIEPLKRTTVMYRATSAGHPGCNEQLSPYTSYAQAFTTEAIHGKRVRKFFKSVEERKTQLRLDWDMFDVHNMIWKDHIIGQEQKRKLDTKGAANATTGGPKWLFLDVWGMSLQRADAHYQAGDCLHWCAPSIYWEWTRHLYHTLYLESEK
ncbi:hypothetical protein FA15DRAFT_670730 [Coprinopsis marcescibilis]|uniref:Uncharacterized protein n=1 Tax=Coprinopsis marcescibilis TaxID=230819 RepID=A0A5C3KRP2_COPMA|nr:hypothetical protein FA15DRAFT_670730 [Coprinopsis marcescibilis]